MLLSCQPPQWRWGLLGLVQFRSVWYGLPAPQNPFVAHLHKLLLLYRQVEMGISEFALELDQKFVIRELTCAGDFQLQSHLSSFSSPPILHVVQLVVVIHEFRQIDLQSFRLPLGQLVQNGATWFEISLHGKLSVWRRNYPIR